MKSGQRKLCDVPTYDWKQRAAVAEELLAAGIDYEVYWHHEHVRYAVDVRDLAGALLATKSLPFPENRDILARVEAALESTAEALWNAACPL